MKPLFQLIISLFLSTASAKSLNESNTVIMIMVDGMRPDYVERFVKQGNLTNISKYFYQEGTVAKNAFTSLSLTTPSWSAILTGRDVDRTGIKGNELFDRFNKNIDNFLDGRRDLLEPKYRQHGRVYRLLRQANNPLVIDYFNRGHERDSEGFIEDRFGKDSDVYMTVAPINDAFPTHVFRTLIDNATHLDDANGDFQKAIIKFLYDKRGNYILDEDNVQQALKVITDTKSKKKKFIGIYLAAIDHYSHLEAGKGLEAMNFVDNQIGKIVRAVNRSRYSNSTVVLVSDHGSISGPPTGDPSARPLGLTITNLAFFLTGWYNYPGYEQYAFNATAALAPEGTFSLKNWREIQMQPYQCHTLARILSEGKFKSCENIAPETISAGITSSQTIAIPYANQESRDWQKPNNWFTLTNYGVSRDQNGQWIKRNLIADLENFELRNTKDTLSARPLDWLAIRIGATEFNWQVFNETPSDLDPIMIHQSDLSQAIILAKHDNNGELLLRYIPIKNFRQESNGAVSFLESSEKDPFGYIDNPKALRETSHGFVKDEDWFKSFHSEHEWVRRYAEATFPNAVSAVFKTMSFRKEGKAFESAKRFDILLNPRYGHYFSIDNDDIQSTHGMFQRESVGITLALRGPSIKKSLQYEMPILAIDILPSLFYGSGMASEGLIEQFDFDGKVVKEIFR